MGQVYRATDVALGRAVAIKILPDALSAVPDRMARFEREARTLAALNHPSIAAIYGFEKYDGVRALVMEFVEGDDLSRRIARGPIPIADALPIARQIADALEAAHEIGVVHRDLKPANIRIRPDGTVKVLDFGLAKAMDPIGSGATADAMNAPTLTSPAMTHAGMILGTAAYMAPEPARGRVVDRRADIWAFGVVVFEMLSGRRVFGGDDVTDTIVSVVSKEPDWNALPPIPAALRRMLERALRKDPNSRLRDIGEARVQIGELMSGTPDARVEPPPPQERRARSTAWTWVFAGAIAVLAATVMWLWAPWRAALPANIPEWGFGRRTFADQAVFNARFMPDGQTIVFSSALSGNAPGLFEVRADSLVPRPFGPPRTHLLAVSSKGELAVLTNTVFLDHRLFSGTLARMPMDGAPRPLAEDVREVDWLPDGSDLVVVREIPGGDQLEFPTGHVVHKVTGYLSDPRVSPDGSRVAFMEHPVKFDNRGFVKVVDRAGVVTTISGEFGEGQGIA